MDRAEWRRLEKLDRFQSELRKLDEDFRTASLASSIAKWVAIGGLAVTSIKLVPGVSYHEIGVTASGAAFLICLLAGAIWLEQRGKATNRLRASWLIADRAEKEGVLLDSSGSIRRDDLGRPINPFATDEPQ